jgi:hypothetical protein
MNELSQFFQFLNDSNLGVTIRENDYLFPSIESLHVLADAVVFGSIAMVDLHLLGLTFKRSEFTKVSTELLPFTWFAFVLALVSGVLLFISNAVNYSANNFFQAKILLLLLAGLNMMVFQHLISKDHHRWAQPSQIPSSARLAGFISLSLWLGIILCGRWIGFTIEPVLVN